MWWTHLLRLLWRAWNQVLRWNSATTFSILKEVIFAPLILLAISHIWALGKDSFKLSAIRNRSGDISKKFLVTVIGMLALIVLCFALAIPVTVYYDHMDLVNRIKKLTSDQHQPVTKSGIQILYKDEDLNGKTIRLSKMTDPTRISEMSVDDRDVKHPKYYIAGVELKAEGPSTIEVQYAYLTLGTKVDLPKETHWISLNSEGTEFELDMKGLLLNPKQPPKPISQEFMGSPLPIKKEKVRLRIFYDADVAEAEFFILPPR